MYIFSNYSISVDGTPTFLPWRTYMNLHLCCAVLCRVRIGRLTWSLVSRHGWDSINAFKMSRSTRRHPDFWDGVRGAVCFPSLQSTSFPCQLEPLEHPQRAALPSLPRCPCPPSNIQPRMNGSETLVCIASFWAGSRVKISSCSSERERERGQPHH